MQMVISDPKTGKSYKVDIPNEKEAEIVGKKIGDTLDGGFVGAGGYKLELTGGSDASGFPMRVDIAGLRKGKFLVTKGVGFKTKRKGVRRRKTLRGNIYSNDSAQVNSKVLEYGPTALDEIFKKEEKAGEKK